MASRRVCSALLLLLASLLAHQAAGCNDVIINDQQCSPSGQAVVSGRTFSFGAELGPRVTAGPPGARLALLEVAADTPAPLVNNGAASLAIKHPFACISHKVEALWDSFPPSDPLRQPNHALCVDGLNQAGLSVAVLYQEETASMPAYDPAAPKKAAVNFLDLPAMLLASFATVAEAEAALRHETQVVWAPRYNTLGRLVSAGEQDAPPLHVTVHDASGASLVVQFREGVMEVLRNDELGVFANRPLLQEQVQHLEAWKREHGLDSPQGASAGGTPQPYVLPGDYSSRSRFTRMALLRAATLKACWPTQVGNDTQTLSPGVLPPGGSYPADNPVLLAVLGVLQSVYLPRGIDDDGVADASPARRGALASGAAPGMPASLEVTPYTTLRDHTRRTFMYRTANGMVFRSLNLQTMAWADQGAAAKLLHKPLQPAAQPWVVADSLPQEARKAVHDSGTKARLPARSLQL